MDHAGNAVGFTIERADGFILSYNAETGAFETFVVLPEDGAVDLPPYEYQNGEIVSILSEPPQGNPNKYACYYACYFCGDFREVITGEEYKRLETTGELYEHDTLDYESVFDGKIYPTLAESACAQLAAFGYHYHDDRRTKPSLAEQITAATEKAMSSPGENSRTPKLPVR